MADAPSTQPTREAVYQRRAERARADKPPSRGTALGAAAHTRVPGETSRARMQAAILAEDGALLAGHFGTVYYKPLEVAGVALKLEPLHPVIGTVVHGLDLASDLERPGMVAFLRQLWLERGVLGFRGQAHLSREAFAAFASHFGEVGAPYGEHDHMPNAPEDLSEQDEVGGQLHLLVLRSDATVPGAASGWHADATWQARPPMASTLICRKAPPVGGDTCFCDARAMWEALSPASKERAKNLTAVHVGAPIHRMNGVTPVAVHPVARSHPETGRTSLYVQQGFVRRFSPEHGLSEDEERALLLEMKLLEGRPEYTCRFRWEPGSVVMWDNRTVLHCASGDFWPHERVVERLTILDDDESRRTPYYKPA